MVGKTVEELDEAIAQIDAQIKQLQQDRCDLETERAARLCPHFVGKVVPCPKMPEHMCTYQGERVRITYIYPSQKHERSWRVLGELIDQESVNGKFPMVWWEAVHDPLTQESE